MSFEFSTAYCSILELQCRCYIEKLRCCPAAVIWRTREEKQSVGSISQSVLNERKYTTYSSSRTAAGGWVILRSHTLSPTTLKHP